MRTVASRELPIASTVSAELQALMAGVPEPSVYLRRRSRSPSGCGRRALHYNWRRMRASRTVNTW